MLPLAIVGFSSSVALVAALLIGGFAVVALVALLARSDGDLALQAAAAARQKLARERMGRVARGVGGAALAIVVVLLAVADDAATRGRAVAGLLGVVVALAGDLVAGRVAAWATPRWITAAAAGEHDGARALARRAGAIAADLAEAGALLVAAIVALTIDDRMALLALAAGSGATAALLGRGDAPAAWLLAATALPGSAAPLAVAAIARLVDVVAARWRPLPRFAAPLATAAVVPLLLPPDLVPSHVGWPGAGLHLPLLLGVLAAPLVSQTACWLAQRDAPDDTPRDRTSDAAWLLLWGGALAAIAWQLGGSGGVAWLALGFALASRRADEALLAPLHADALELARGELAPPLAPSEAAAGATIGAFARLLACTAAVVAIGARADRSPVRPPFAQELGALLFGAVAGLFLLALLGRARRAASTGGGLGAMIPAFLWSAIVAIELPRLAPALLGSAFAGVVVVGFLSSGTAAHEALAAVPRPATRPLLPAWIVVMVLLALATAPGGR